MDRDPGSCHGGGRAAERGGRLVGESDHRSRARAEEGPQYQRRYRRPARQHRCLPDEPPAPALQRCESATCYTRGPQPGRLHAYAGIRGNGDKAWWGWPTSPTVEKEVTAWFDAKNLDEEKAAVSRLNKAALEDVIYAPTGFFLSYTAWRKNISGIVKGPLPFLWDVSKSA